MMNRALRYTGLAALLIPVLAGGCGEGADNPQTDAVPRVDVVGVPGSSASPGTGSDKGSVSTPDGQLEELGLWRGHWDGSKLSFSPIDQRAASSTIRPQGFVNLPDTKLAVSTDEALVYNSSCPQLADPANYYFTTGPRSLSTGSSCPDHHLCALVSISNDSTRDIYSAFVQVTSISPGFGVDGPVDSVPTGYPLDDSMGLWSYGTISPGAGGQAEWHFALPNCSDFTFDVKMMGTLTRTSYGANAAAIPSSSWIDACSLPGHTAVLANAGPGAYVDNVALPFPFTLYDVTFDTDENPYLTINANGTLGFFPVEGNVALPDTSGNSDYSIFPFWRPLQLGSAGVCYGETGVSPNRKFVVTWTNADIVGTAAIENMTFSAVLNETSDSIDFIYNRWSNNQANCAATALPNRGSGATIGVQGVGGAFRQHTTLLPTHPPSCTTDIFRVTLTPSPGNQL